MSYMGRRWGGSHMYDADAAFKSYGVKFDPKALESRDALINAVP